MFNDSLNSAIHTSYHSWLCSSLICEPRDPPSKVVFSFAFFAYDALCIHNTFSVFNVQSDIKSWHSGMAGGRNLCLLCVKLWMPVPTPKDLLDSSLWFQWLITIWIYIGNDPSTGSGSPTQTLIKLLLPINPQWQPLILLGHQHTSSGWSVWKIVKINHWP